MKHRVQYIVVTPAPRRRVLWIFQGPNAKRDATRHARRYARTTNAPAKVEREPLNP